MLLCGGLGLIIAGVATNQNAGSNSSTIGVPVLLGSLRSNLLLAVVTWSAIATMSFLIYHRSRTTGVFGRPFLGPAVAASSLSLLLIGTSSTWRPPFMSIGLPPIPGLRPTLAIPVCIMLAGYNNKEHAVSVLGSAVATVAVLHETALGGNLLYKYWGLLTGGNNAPATWPPLAWAPGTFSIEMGLLLVLVATIVSLRKSDPWTYLRRRLDI